MLFMLFVLKNLKNSTFFTLSLFIYFSILKSEDTEMKKKILYIFKILKNKSSLQIAIQEKYSQKKKQFTINTDDIELTLDATKKEVSLTLNNNEGSQLRCFIQTNTFHIDRLDAWPQGIGNGSKLLTFCIALCKLYSPEGHITLIDQASRNGKKSNIYDFFYFSNHCSFDLFYDSEKILHLNEVNILSNKS